MVLQRRQERIDALVALQRRSPSELLEATMYNSGWVRKGRDRHPLRSSSACAVILDHYDRCYSYELNRRTTAITPLPVDGLSAAAVANQLLQLKSA